MAARCPTCNVPLTIEEEARPNCPVCGHELSGQVSPPVSRPEPAPRRESPPDRYPEPIRAEREERERRRSWDEGYDEPQARYERDRFRRRLPRTLPGKGLTQSTLILLALSSLMELLSLGIYASILPQIGDQLVPRLGDPEPNLEMSPALILMEVANCFHLMTFLPAGIVFLCWVHRAYNNLILMRVEGLRYTPGWAVGYFFIPFVNLFYPCIIFQEMWRASNPDAPASHDPEDDRTDWRRNSGNPLIGLWWAFWILSNFAGTFAALAQFGNRSVTYSSILPMIMVSNGLTVVAGLVLLSIVWNLRIRQEARFQTLGDVPDEPLYHDDRDRDDRDRYDDR